MMQKRFSIKQAVANATRRARAVFVALVRNSELKGMRNAIRHIEDRFNRNYGYPWVFLNDEEFTEEFKLYTSSIINSPTYYGLVPKDHWSIPEWIDEEKARIAREDQAKRNVPYGGSLSYRHMCRFESGFFFHHPLLQDYDYYWRVEPNVEYFCDLDYDPFLFMQDNGKKYGWTLSLRENEHTIPTLWETTRRFMNEYPHLIPPNNTLDFITHDGGVTYNRCHFWSNFEIGDLRFWRSEAYMTYFEYLDKAGGFFYERWGDAPVHTIAAAMFLRSDEIHFFNDIGYKHYPFMHCPTEKELQLKCTCDPGQTYDNDYYSCTPLWHYVNQPK
ncbi:uncharacterized protein VTP21DRAFT_5350 [Calcarisporiella thermophila]|uniref:uncharacterized protein n=1 Tax=Calcarisporiella thermophila TaxID=911321 RepID=UPI003743A267